MKRTVNWMMSKAKSFSILDWAIFKTLLLSIGAMLGAYCSKFFKKLAPLMWLIIAIGYAYMIYRIFFGKGKKSFKIMGYRF